MAYIFLLEVIVDDLSVFSDGQNSPAQDGSAQRQELCVRLQLASLVRCEVCEKDFGSALDMEVRKTGENCLFAFNPGAERFGEEDESLDLKISAHGKGPDGTKRLIGGWREPGREMLLGLAQAYDLQNGLSDPNGSKESLSSGQAVTNAKRNKPVSNTLKAMYPLEAGTDGTSAVVGFVVLTIRMSCLGPNINQKVLFGGRDLQQQPVTCYKVEDEPVVQCVTLEDQDEEQLVAPHSSLASVVGTAIVPEAEPYDEYAAELNGNAICIRVEKDANISTSLALPDGVYGLEEECIRREANSCKLPIVRGNLKYPAYHWTGDFLIGKKTTPITVHDYRKRPDPARTVGLQTAERLERACAGIEICRKGWHDPNVDVFVLKLGKNKRKTADGSPRNEVEIELRTPRGPSREIRPKETRGVQVIEEEFEPPREVAKPAVGGDGGEPTGKKAKPAGKKGKKK
uniref:Uncharacterized protein n=1 Tax=Anopheles epiroticus TaxID=199890 RepID=A0A182PRL3_9DIPT